MALCMSAALISCGGGGTSTSGSGGDSNGGNSGGGESSAATNINVLIFTGTATRNGANKWIFDAAERFTELKKEETYESGKKGVNITIQDNKNIPYDSLSSDGNDIYLDEAKADMYTYSASNELMQLDEIVNYIESDQGLTIDADAKKRMLGYQSADGQRHYYGLPQYEWSNSLTYDVNYFEEAGLYFAKPDATKSVTHEGNYGTVKFVDPTDIQKSCGPDGEYNTPDDGLPSSLEELLILSGELKNKTGTGPFTVTGSNLYYTNYLVEGLWASLAGSKELKTVYDFSGSVDVVTGYTEENLFKGIDYIKKPVVTKTEITDKNGNLALKSAARYYAASFIEILHKEGFFSDISSSVSHTGAQKNFINGGVRNNSIRAFLVDGSYWYNESTDQGNFKDYTTMTGKTTRGVRFMALPVTATGSVTPSETAATPSLIDNGIAYAYINARYSDKTEIVNACKTFLKFLYSDAELKEFTALTGVTRPLTYSLTDAQYNSLPEYQQKVYDLSRNSDILYFGSENPIFKNNQQTLKIHFSSQIMNPTVNNTQYKSYYEAIKGGATSKNVFEATVITDDVWKNIAKKQGTN